MTAHAMLSASSSKRWMMCTPSARLEATLPEQKRGAGAFDFSQEGTMAHALAEAKLRHHYNQIGIEEFQREVEIVKATPYYNEEFEAYVDDYVLYVRSQIGEGDTPLFEQRVDFSEFVPDGFGTADVIILSDSKIRVIDLKFGRGVPVEAQDNSQLRLYALGAYCKFKEEYPNLKEVEYTIHQPRLHSITTDGTTVTKLLDWAQYYVAPKAKKAWAGSGDFLPGEWCGFCRAKATCRARSDYNNELAKMEFRDPPLLSDTEIAKVLKGAQELRSWVSDVEEHALTTAVNSGVLPPGYKLGKTTTHRKISDSAMAAVVLREKGLSDADLWEQPKMKSIASLEKLAPKGQVVAWLGDLVQRPEGSPKLVPTGDFQ